MFKWLLENSLANRLLVLMAGAVLMAYGAFTLSRTPVDVFPDLNNHPDRLPNGQTQQFRTLHLEIQGQCLLTQTARCPNETQSYTLITDRQCGAADVAGHRGVESQRLDSKPFWIDDFEDQFTGVNHLSRNDLR